MDTYGFDKYVPEISYPKSSTTVSFGGGYQFASAPNGPDQRTFTLYYKAMVYFLNEDGTYDLTTQPSLNAGALEAFYQAHRLYDPFIFPHPALGNITVRFAEPLTLKVQENGRGLTEPFSVKLIEQP